MQKMKERVPSFQEISPTKGLNLDETSAVEHFLGKTCQEAFSMIQENINCYAEDFAYMGYIAFCYYLPSLYQFIHAIDHQDDHFEEAVDAMLFIAEMRYMNDYTNRDHYKTDIKEILNICFKGILHLMSNELYDKRERRRRKSRLNKILSLKEKYL